MPSPLLDNEYESAGPVALEEQPSPALPSQPSTAELLDRISELEDENARLRKLEEIIRANNHLFEVLLDAGHETILLLSPALIIVRLVHSIVGYAERDVLGQSIVSFMHPDDVPQLEKCCAQLLRGETKRCSIEGRALTPQGNWIGVELQLTDLLDDPNVQAIVVNIRRSPSHPA